MTEQYQIFSDNNTLWVNSSNGSCVARFGIYGIDIHREFTKSGACEKAPARITKMTDDYKKMLSIINGYYKVIQKDFRMYCTKCKTRENLKIVELNNEEKVYCKRCIIQHEKEVDKRDWINEGV